MYTPRLLKITAANILIFIIKKQTVIKHSKTNIILIDIVKFNLVVLGILLHYDSWQEGFGLSYLFVNYAIKHSSVQTKCLNGC